jgi:O-antigen ligase
MILILFLIWVIKEIHNKNLLKIIKELPQNKFFIPVILLVIAATISVFIAPAQKPALGIWKAYFIEPLLLFLVFIHNIKTKSQVNKIIWSLGLSAVIISLIAIAQYVSNVGIPESYNLPNIKRATSVYGYPSAVGLFLAPILTLFIGIIIEKFRIKNKKSKLDAQNIFINSKYFVIGIIIMLLLITAIILAKTEGAIIAVLVSTFFVLMFTKYRRLVIAGTLIAILMIFLIPQTRGYVVTLLTFRDVSGDVRIALWQGTLRLIKNHPVFGAGLAGFPELYKQYKEAKHIEISLYPHNIFLNFWVETGILGLISLLWIIVNFFRKGFKNLSYKLQTTNYSLSLIAVMICILIYGLVDAPYFKNDLSCLFWIWIGLIIVSSKLELKESA